MSAKLARYGLIILLLCAQIVLAGPAGPGGQPRPSPGASQPAQSGIPFIDAHAHIARSLNPRQNDVGGDVAAALEAMTRHGITMTILSPPPNSPADKNTYGLREEQAIVRGHPDRFAFTAGGESLNIMIQQTPPEKVTSELVSRFERTAAAIVDGGAAGFGEIAAEHFSSGRPGHPYESAPPDHPLILALADIAAKAGMPVEIHMEALPQDKPLQLGPPNPPIVKENIAAFERLLDHNKAARIVWLHAGWDLSGERTVELMRDLLAKHPNLYMTIKSDPAGNRRNSPLAGGRLKREWLELLRAFPDRFVIGSDIFFDDLRAQDKPPVMARLQRARRIVDELPPELANLVTVENVKRIYRLSRAPR
jgi:hypothetical protein